MDRGVGAVMVSGETRRMGVAEKGAVALTDGRCQSPETSEQIFIFCFPGQHQLVVESIDFLVEMR